MIVDQPDPRETNLRSDSKPFSSAGSMTPFSKILFVAVMRPAPRAEAMKASVAGSMRCYPFAASGMRRSIAFKKTSAPGEARFAC